MANLLIKAGDSAGYHDGDIIGVFSDSRIQEVYPNETDWLFTPTEFKHFLILKINNPTDEQIEQALEGVEEGISRIRFVDYTKLFQESVVEDIRNKDVSVVQWMTTYNIGDIMEVKDGYDN